MIQGDNFEPQHKYLGSVGEASMVTIAYYIKNDYEDIIIADKYLQCTP